MNVSQKVYDSNSVENTYVSFCPPLAFTKTSYRDAFEARSVTVTCSLSLRMTSVTVFVAAVRLRNGNGCHYNII